MKKETEEWKELNDWDLLCRFLPEGWEEKAQESGALKRAREVPNAAVLLRILLLHLANGYSLKETALRAREAGWAQVSDVAVMKRLRMSEEWLRWLSEQMRAGLTRPLPSWNRRVVVVDATTVSEPGSTGTDWRIHYAMNLSDCQCRYWELTDRRGGETWRRFPVQEDEVVMGDRIYATPVSVAHVVNKKGDVIVRLNRQSLPLYIGKGESFSPLAWAQGLRIGKVKECSCWVKRTGRGKNRGETSGGETERRSHPKGTKTLTTKSEPKPKARIGGLSGSGGVFVYLDHLRKRVSGEISVGFLSRPLADRVGIQTDEIPNGVGALTEKRPPRSPGVAAWEVIGGATGGTDDRGGGLLFPLGI